MEKLDLSRYDGLEKERWQYSWPSAEDMDTYIRIAGQSGQIVAQVRGWGYLHRDFGAKKAAEIQDKRGHFIADAPKLLAELKSTRAEVERLRKQVVDRNELLTEIGDTFPHVLAGCWATKLAAELEGKSESQPAAELEGE